MENCDKSCRANREIPAVREIAGIISYYDQIAVPESSCVLKNVEAGLSLNWLGFGIAQKMGSITSVFGEKENFSDASQSCSPTS